MKLTLLHINVWKQVLVLCVQRPQGFTLLLWTCLLWEFKMLKYLYESNPPAPYILDYSYAGLPTTENGNPEYE